MMRIFFSLTLIIFSCNALLAAPEKPITDTVYNNSIRTVLLHPFTGAPDGSILPPVISLKQTRGALNLEFDEIGSDFRNYYVKVINCNKDWTPSNLSSIMIVEDFNEFFISDRQQSSATIIPYIHYNFSIPAILCSGNFILKVYADMDENQVMLTKRFIVYEEKVNIGLNIHWSSVVSTQRTHQQVDFMLNLGGMNIINPFQNLYPVIRQNFRFDNMITGLKPAFYGDNNSQLNYSFYNNENAFPAGYEFRRFEGQSIISPMYNVGRIIRNTNGNEVQLYMDETTANGTYTFWKDVNGYYMPYQFETKGFTIEPDYIYVTFFIKSAPLDGKVYVFGALSNWQADPMFEMKYDEINKGYWCRSFLKQGYYNYKYLFVPTKGKPDEAYFEGNYAATENFYDVIVYYREPGGLYDKAIGYTAFDYGKR